jgi:hypothetical protein
MDFFAKGLRGGDPQQTPRLKAGKPPLAGAAEQQKRAGNPAAGTPYGTVAATPVSLGLWVLAHFVLGSAASCGSQLWDAPCCELSSALQPLPV